MLSDAKTQSLGNATALERQWEAFELGKAGGNPTLSVWATWSNGDGKISAAECCCEVGWIRETRLRTPSCSQAMGEVERWERERPMTGDRLRVIIFNARLMQCCHACALQNAKISMCQMTSILKRLIKWSLIKPGLRHTHTHIYCVCSYFFFNTSEVAPNVDFETFMYFYCSLGSNRASTVLYPRSVKWLWPHSQSVCSTSSLTWWCRCWHHKLLLLWLSVSGKCPHAMYILISLFDYPSLKFMTLVHSTCTCSMLEVLKFCNAVVVMWNTLFT